ncbi:MULTISPECIES: lipase secretion chaperone [unclassified Acidovorax]|uniref:lipase secretion chaperone n=1 Tax=unclassified Acidovorax TaxID=2684926 RepID=UPI001C476D78|nr:lipase chaperone [Acidovorax sp. sif0732]MBV7450636.1 lipase chaperone [Acidovorax sp. sif0715]
MEKRSRAFAAAVALAAATAAVVWWTAPHGLQSAEDPHPGAGGAGPQAGSARQNPSGSARPMESSFFAARRAAGPDRHEDPLLVHGLRDTLEALLMEAQDGGAADPATLKQRLAGLVGKHFPAALAARALALAERYVDYRVALGQLRTPPDPTDPGALREALEARHKVRQQFFDGPEHDALFAREADLDRYTLARLEIERNPRLTAEQRTQALRDAENELPQARRAERAAATEHLSAAAQTAAFNAQNTDERTRHAARSAQYGEAAAHAMAQLDREEQSWQQRLDQYSQARAQPGDGRALESLRQQLFSPQEQQRLDAALALRKLPPATPGS